MKATQFEFRFRMALLLGMVVLGLWAPWIEWLGWGARRPHFGLWVAIMASRAGFGPLTATVPAAIILFTLVAVVGAALRVCGAAYLEPFTVMNPQMQSGAVMAAGPYRFLRNPLYLGSYCVVAALSYVMPPTGAAFTLVIVGVFLLRLMLAEESFLADRLGSEYLDYKASVPRLIPRLRTSLPMPNASISSAATTTTPASPHPNWPRGFLAEVFPIALVLILGVFTWSYDNHLMLRAVLVAYGLSLFARAFVSSAKPSGN